MRLWWSTVSAMGLLDMLVRRWRPAPAPPAAAEVSAWTIEDALLEAALRDSGYAEHAVPVHDGVTSLRPEADPADVSGYFDDVWRQAKQPTARWKVGSPHWVAVPLVAMPTVETVEEQVLFRANGVSLTEMDLDSLVTLPRSDMSHAEQLLSYFLSNRTARRPEDLGRRARWWRTVVIESVVREMFRLGWTLQPIPTDANRYRLEYDLVRASAEYRWQMWRDVMDDAGWPADYDTPGLTLTEVLSLDLATVEAALALALDNGAYRHADEHAIVSAVRAVGPESLWALLRAFPSERPRDIYGAVASLDEFAVRNAADLARTWTGTLPELLEVTAALLRDPEHVVQGE